MKLISTTLVGNNEDIIEGALASVVEWVDTCLVIDTGSSDRSLERARRVAGAKYVERKFPWVSDFAAARNFALDAATAEDGAWAVTVDTDERIELRGEPIRDVLAATTAGALRVAHVGDGYQKERFFRLPCPVRWVGATHEGISMSSLGVERLRAMRFAELPKSAETITRKHERDRVILEEWTRRRPEDPRWHFYLGEALHGLRSTDDAIRAFDRCAELRGWSEESAWACYRSAECHVEQRRLVEAVDRCTRGLARHAGIGELAWLAGWASYQDERYDQAIAWGHSAAALGMFEGVGSIIARIGFRKLVGLYEGPFDVLRHAYRRVGRAEDAKTAHDKFLAARAMREAAMNGSERP